MKLGPRLAVVLLAIAAVAGGAAADPLSLNVDQMRIYGGEAVARGYADQALEIADALLSRDTQDSAAWAIRAQALREKGDLAGSAAAARSAWATSDSPANRYTAATSLAQALSLQGHRMVAQYWLRQAAQNAPNAGTRAQAEQDYRYVRSQNPLRLQFDAAIKPSDNVNNGTPEFILGYIGTAGGAVPLYLPPEFTPLSGYAWSLGLTGSYKLAERQSSEDALTFALNTQGIVLSAAAQKTAPAADPNNYAFSQIETGWQHKAALSFGFLTSDIKVGHNWYGMTDLSDRLSAGLTLDHDFSNTVQGSLEGLVTRQIRIDRPQSTSTQGGLTASLDLTGPGGDQWQVAAAVSRSASADPGVQSVARSLTVVWSAGKPLMGLGLGAYASFGATSYDSGRYDERTAFGVSANVTKIGYLGFSPVVSLDYSSNASTFRQFATKATGLGISLKSNF
ncbi:MAG: hypothetical protein ABI832_05320 [bacterium]